MALLLPLRASGRDGKVGFIDENGSWVIEPRFDLAARFAEGRAMVRVNRQYGFIDEAGEFCIAPTFDGANWFSCGFSCASNKGVHRFIDRLGAVLDTPKLDAPSSFKERLAVVRVRERSRILRLDGTFATERSFTFARGFSEGLAAACDEGQWQFVDGAGETVLKVNGVAENFGDGLAAVKQPGKGVAFVNRAAERVIVGPFVSASAFSNGRAMVQKRSGLYGFIDTSGREVVAARYAVAQPFAFGRAWVREEARGPAQAIDVDGNVVASVPADYDLLAPFFDAAALVAGSVGEHYVLADGRVLEGGASS